MNNVLIFFLFAMFALRNRSAVCMMAWWRGLFVLSNWCIQRPSHQTAANKAQDLFPFSSLDFFPLFSPICSLCLHWMCLHFLLLVLFSSPYPWHCFFTQCAFLSTTDHDEQRYLNDWRYQFFNSIFLPSLGSHVRLIEYKSERRRWLCMSSDDQKFLQTFSSPNLLTGWLNKMSIIPK